MPPAPLRVVAIIQARLGSTRLPGKTLADIAGQSLLAHIIDRTRASRRICDVVIATTREAADDAIAALAKAKGIRFTRGSTDDVLDRFYHAGVAATGDIIVRITADDPFKDPDVIDMVVERLLADPLLDYASNTLEPSFPEGLDVEAFTSSALARAWAEARLPSEREHVTPYIWNHPELFRLASVKNARDLSQLRWTLDYEEDLIFTREIYRRLYRNHIFKMEDILQLLAIEPQLKSLNSGIARNAGYNFSLQKDRLPSSP